MDSSKSSRRSDSPDARNVKTEANAQDKPRRRPSSDSYDRDAKRRSASDSSKEAKKYAKQQKKAELGGAKTKTPPQLALLLSTGRARDRLPLRVEFELACA